MPTISLLSDLHFEFHQDGGKEFLAQLDPTGIDILVLAGDICQYPDIEPVLTHFCSRYPHVVFVPGNHDHWHTTIDAYHKLLRGLRLPNLHVLLNSKETILGLVFAGGTLWYPRPDDPDIYRRRLYFADYRFMREFEPSVYEQNRDFVQLLKHSPGVDVFVTHHLPAKACIALPFRGSSINHFFCHDLINIILDMKPRYWLFGHTHTPMQENIGDTKMYCNPFGYPNEPKDQFQAKLIIEVAPKVVAGK